MLRRTSQVTAENKLMARQQEIMATALSQGFAGFPRKINLTQLSELVGVKPPTLSETLGAERRIKKNVLGMPFDEFQGADVTR
jgi:predicted DNA binding protein